MGGDAEQGHCLVAYDALLHPFQVRLLESPLGLFDELLLITGAEGVIVLKVALRHYVFVVFFGVHCEIANLQGI